MRLSAMFKRQVINVWFMQQEYEAEQEYIKTLSYLSAEEQRKYKGRQSVSFMYQKPPGMDNPIGKPKV